MKSESKIVFFRMIDLIESVKKLFRGRFVKIAKEIIKSPVHLHININGNMDGFDIYLVFSASSKQKEYYRAKQEEAVLCG